MVPLTFRSAPGGRPRARAGERVLMYALVTRTSAGTETIHRRYATPAEVIAFADGRYPAHDDGPPPSTPDVEWHVELDIIAWIEEVD
jgi:hypothetical protein